MPSCCCHQGGLVWKSAKWHVGNISWLSLLRGGPSMWWARERLPWAAPNTETPGLTWHSLSSILNSSVLFSALEFQSRPGTAKLRTHRKVYKRFSQVAFDFLPTSYKTYLQPTAITELARVVMIGARRSCKHYCMHFTDYGICHDAKGLPVCNHSSIPRISGLEKA